MENGRNWQGWAALLMAGLALFVALSGHMNFSFSLSDGGATAVAPVPTFRFDKGQTVPLPNQDTPPQLNPVPAQPVAPQGPQLKLQPPVAPDAPQGWPGWHNARGFGPFGGGGGFGGGPFAFLPRLLPVIGIGLLAWFFFFRRRGHWQQRQAARRATTPLQSPPPEGPSGGQS
jgi:hypothetical protein